MKVIHRLVGYDKTTDRAKVRFDIADRFVGDVKRIAKVPDDDPEAVWSYPLTPEQVRKMAKLIGAEFDLGNPSSFLKPSAVQILKKERNRGPDERQPEL